MKQPDQPTESEGRLFESGVDARLQHQRIARLLMRLGSKDSADRWTAQTELRRTAALPVPVLLAHLAHIERIRRQSPFLIFLGLLASLFLVLALLLVFDTMFGRISHIPALVAGLVVAVLMQRRWMAMRAAATRALANYNDARQVGPLAQFLAEGNGDPNRQAVARDLLIQLLPRIQRQHADELTEQQRAGLLALLDRDDTPLLLALLQSLARIGDAATEQRIHIMVNEKEPRNRMANEQVREEAKRCIDALAGVRVRQRLKNDMLRMVDPNE